MHDHARVREVLEVGEGWQPRAENLVYLRAKASFDFSVIGEQIPRPGEGNGGGFVSSYKEVDSFVAKLNVVHRLVGLLISRMD